MDRDQDVIAGRAISAIALLALALMAALERKFAPRASGMITKMQQSVQEILSSGADLHRSSARSSVAPADQAPVSIHRAMRHSVFAGGKRLRPVLCLEAARMIGGRAEIPQGVEELGAAIEMLHTYSLIHDDLPALDDDDLRRGKPTCHVAFGEAIAILAGDALQTQAYEVLARMQCPAAATVEIVRSIAQATGTVEGMIGGQVMDLEAEEQPADRGTGGSDPSRQDRRIDSRQPGRRGHLRGRIARATSCVCRQFGRKAGLAFQIMDDVLDVTQNSSQLGKTAGKDVASEKATWPAVYGVDQSVKDAERLVDEAFAQFDRVRGARRSVEGRGPLSGGAQELRSDCGEQDGAQMALTEDDVLRL